MLEIKLFRENPEVIRESERKRYRDPKRVDLVIELDEKWRKSFENLNALRQKRNEITHQISKKAKAKEDISELKNEVIAVNKEIKIKEKETEGLLSKRNKKMMQIGNILHDKVPIGETEEENISRRTWGEIREFEFEPKGHADLIVDLGKADLERAANISGSRFYYLIDDLVFLNFALIQLGFKILRKHDYTIYQTPFMIQRKYMEGAAELSDFEDTLYKIDGEDLFLIATSEQSLVSLHANEIIREDALPLRYGGISTCFRKEAGTSGKDTKGIFRVHQFEKVEQFVFCDPDKSWDEHEKMIRICEELFQELDIPYRIVDIASGDLNLAAARKYDLEGWFPTQNRYRELASCSNVTDYQSNKLKIRTGYHGAEKVPVHTLNSTVVATERTICCILENYQQEDGSILIPGVLRPYMNNKKYIYPVSEEKASKEEKNENK